MFWELTIHLFDIGIKNLIVQRQKSEYIVYSKSKRNNILLKGKAYATV